MAEAAKLTDGSGNTLRSNFVYREVPRETLAIPLSGPTVRVSTEPTREQNIDGEARYFPIPTPNVAVAAGRKHVDGVIARISGDECLVHCEASADRFDLRLPLSLISDDLRLIGQPVKISLDRQLGFRIPKIERRAAELRAPNAGEVEMMEWVAHL
jgi:hypothetical protein